MHDALIWAAAAEEEETRRRKTLSCLQTRRPVCCCTPDSGLPGCTVHRRRAHEPGDRGVEGFGGTVHGCTRTVHRSRLSTDSVSPRLTLPAETVKNESLLATKMHVTPSSRCSAIVL